MKHSLLYFVIVFSLFAFFDKAKSQNIQLDFTNRELSADGKSWTFDLEVKGDATTGYQGNNAKWQAFNIRLNLSIPAGISILGGTGTADPAFTKGNASVNVLAPGDPGMGQNELALSLARTNQQDLSTSEFIKLATFTINFSGPVDPNSIVTPRLATEKTGSSWTNLNEGGQLPLRKPLDITNAFPLKTGALPVKLIKFSASKQENKVILKWSTSEEIGSERFDIQRSKNGKQWTMFKSVMAHGDSKAEISYEAFDSDPFDGENLYRLHMIDKDGTSSYSGIKSIFVDKHPLLLFPNPVSDYLTVKTAQKNIVNIKVLSEDGREVYQSGSSVIEKIKVRGWKPGIYIVRITDANSNTSNYKILVKQ